MPRARLDGRRLAPRAAVPPAEVAQGREELQRVRHQAAGDARDRVVDAVHALAPPPLQERAGHGPRVRRAHGGERDAVGRHGSYCKRSPRHVLLGVFHLVDAALRREQAAAVVEAPLALGRRGFGWGAAAAARRGQRAGGQCVEREEAHCCVAAALYLLQQWRNDKCRSREPEPLVVRCSGAAALGPACLVSLLHRATLVCHILCALGAGRGLHNKEPATLARIVPESRSISFTEHTSK